tara:strand:- start:679 stop:4005 length:3327 start_codon:yes stop_codon:yes gene_type:complete
MGFKGNTGTAIFLTLVMLLSIGFAPITDWGEKANEEEVRPIIDYSLMEDYIQPMAAPPDGECWKVLVVPVTFQDFSNLPHRYNKEELEEFLDEDVDDFLSVSTYNSWCADWTVAPEFTPSIVDDPDTDEDESKSRATNTVAWNIRNSESHSDLASSHSIIGMIYNIPNYAGQSAGWSDYPAFKVTGLGAFTHEGTTYLCDDDGASNLNGDSAWASHGCYVRGDFLGLFAHEALHAMGVSGHSATLYRHCHSVMGSLGCSGPAPPSSWLKLDKEWYPEDFVFLPDNQTWDAQEIKIRPLNLNLLDSIDEIPNSDQIQIVKIPLSSEVNQFGDPDPKHYLLVEYRPRETLNSNGDKVGIVGDADNILHKRQVWHWSTSNGLPSEGVMIYAINEHHNTNPNPGDAKFEPVTVIDANPSTTELNDAAFAVGDVYEYGVEGMPFRVTLEIDSIGNDAIIKLYYETPELNDWSGGGPDMFITPTPKYDGSTPTVTTDIWIDSPSNNFDIDNADNDDDITTGIDAIYRWHEPGDPRTPLEGLSDAPEFDQENWLYVRIKNIGDTPVDFSSTKVSLTWKKPDANGAAPTNKYHHVGYEWDAQQPVCPPQGVFAWGSFCEKNDPEDTYIEYGLMELKEKDGNPTNLWRVREPMLNSADTHPANQEYILGPDEEFIIGGIWRPQQEDFDWIDPTTQEGLIDFHACIDVRIYPVPDEISVGEYELADQAKEIFADIPNYYPNNWAFENIGYFEVFKGSPYNIIRGEFDFWNNLQYTANATFEFVDLPEGLNVALYPETPLQMAPNETVTFEYVIEVDDEWPIGHFDGFDFQGWLETNISGDIHNFAVQGGLRIVVAAVEKVDIEFDVSVENGGIVVDGNMVSQGFTEEGEDYSGSVVSVEYTNADGVSVTRPVAINPGNDTCTARFIPGTSVDVVYVSPSGQSSTSSRTVDANGDYTDDYLMRDAGNWTLSYTYLGRDENRYQWQEVVEITINEPQNAPVAEGYDKSCGVGVFSDVFIGTDEVPLRDGEWSASITFMGDSIHGSAATSSRPVRVEGIPPVVTPPDVTIPDSGEGTITNDNGTTGNDAREDESVSISHAGFFASTAVLLGAGYFARRKVE